MLGRVTVAGQPQHAARSRGLARAHAALGALLGGYVVFHAWQQWPAVIGRDAWLERAQHAALPGALKVVLGAALVAHVVLGALRLRAGAHPADASATAGLRRLQLFFGAIVLVFLAVHVPLVRWTPGPASTVLDVYTRLSDRLGQPAPLAVHLIGVTAVCAHLALGLARGAVSLGLAKSPRLGFYLGGALAGLLLFQLLQVLAVYAIGEPLVPALAPTSPP